MVLRKHEKMVPCSLARFNTNAGFLGSVLGKIFQLPPVVLENV